LAIHVGLKSSSVSWYRTKRAWPDDATMLRIAELAGADQARALLDLNTWRAKSSAVADLYRKMAATVSAVVFAIVLLSPGSGNAAGTKALELTHKYTLCDNYVQGARLSAVFPPTPVFAPGAGNREAFAMTTGPGDGKAASSIGRLLDIMARLRDPDGGCPWDKDQNFVTIAPYTIEEAYEVADAIARGDRTALQDELGDLLFQVVFYAQMAREEGGFDFEAIVRGVCDKMERRHPHVFGDATVAGAEAQTLAWEATKAAERAASAAGAGERHSVLDGVALALPALMRAEKLQKRAARVGFDWSETGQVIDKIDEEIGELRHEIAAASPRAKLEDELGDILFAVANLARHLGIDPEAALRRTNDKFDRRFRFVEDSLEKQGKSPFKASLDEMEALWRQAKAGERDR
jgi:ATP diphosphatase